MRYRKLSDTGDYVFGQGQANFYIDTPAAVAQAAKTRLLLLTQEWFLNVLDGTNYAQKILGVRTQGTRDQEVKQRILGTPGVQRLISYSSQVIDRRFSVQAKIQTVYGAATVEVSL